MNIRSFVATIIGILAVLCLLAFVPKRELLPKGIVLPGKTIRAATLPASVIIYQQAPNGSIENLGIVSIEQSAKVDDTAARNRVLQKVRELAAQVGANGVIVNYFEPHPAEGMGQIFTFMGVAIYTPHSGEKS